MANISKYIENKLGLKVNMTKEKYPNQMISKYLGFDSIMMNSIDNGKQTPPSVNQ